jgi:hypothetical protein
MKKSILLAIIGLAASVAPSFGLGDILLDNYNSFNGNGGPLVTYGPGGLGPVGQGLGAGWTAGLYYALGDVTGSVAADLTGSANPVTLYGGFVLGTGPGSTVAFYTSTGNTTPGEFMANQAFQVAGNPGDTITVMVVAYNGSSYPNSFDRGHSAAFTMPLSLNTNPNPNRVGDFMTGFTIPVPEPTTMALGGLGLAALMLFRRKQV